MPREVKFIERADVDKVRILTSDAVGIEVFLDRLVAAAPFTEPTNCLLVDALEYVLCRKTRADDR